MHRIFLVLGFMTLSLSMFSQTKLIAHKSHSGTEATFIIALNNDLFDNDNSNFGMAPERTVNTAKLDSVIFLSDSAAVMVTSDYCENTRRKTTRLWKAGRDTVYHHALFTHKHSLDSIKNILKYRYYFKNPVDSVKFIGYDNGTEEDDCDIKYESVFATPGNNDKPPFNRIVLITGIILLVSLLSGFLSWKLYPAPALQKM